MIPVEVMETAFCGGLHVLGSGAGLPRTDVQAATGIGRIGNQCVNTFARKRFQKGQTIALVQLVDFHFDNSNVRRSLALSVGGA